MRILVRPPLVRRALVVAVSLTLLTSPSAAHAASDPLAAAVERVNNAARAQQDAVTKLSDAEGAYNQLENDLARSRATIARLTDDQRRLAKLARLRAVVAYQRGSSLFDDLLGDGRDVLDAARRATLLDRANAQGNEAIRQLEIVTDDLHKRESDLRKGIDRAKKALDTMEQYERATEVALAEAGQAEKDLRARLAREKREREYAAIIAAARAKARAAAEAAARRSTNGGGGGNPGQIIGTGSWVCPVQGPRSFTNDWGAPRSGGRTHKGNDIFAPKGTPVVAPVAGSVFFQGDPLGGKSMYVNGNDGNTYYGAHLNDYVGGARAVKAGELVGHVGNSGNADGGASHLHFEIRVGGPNGTRVNPYATLSAHC